MMWSDLGPITTSAGCHVRNPHYSYSLWRICPVSDRTCFDGLTRDFVEPSTYFVLMRRVC